jgi:4-hydroxybenzoate polyprenyltransferase
MLKTLLAFLKLIRVVNLCIIALSLYLFYYLILAPVHKNILYTTLLPFTDKDFALFVLSVIMIAAGGNIINDYYDFEADREFKPGRPLASGLISLNTAFYLHAALVVCGIALGFYLGWGYSNFRIGYLYVICALMLYGYSAYLKKIPLVGNIIIAGLTAFVFVLLLLFEANFLHQITFDAANYALTVMISQLKFYGGFAFITSLAREIVKDIEDREGDEKYDVGTLAVQFGQTVAKVVAGAVLAVLLVVLSMYMKIFYQAHAMKDLAYLGMALVVPVLIVLVLLFMARERKDFARVSLMLKVIMLLGILSIPFFYFFKGQ